VDGYFAAQPGGASIIIAGAEVTAVTPVMPHVCNVARPRRCLGHLHDLTLTPSVHPNCAAVNPRPAPPPRLMANVVIIRHGVTGVGPAPGPWKTLAAVGHPRQILPVCCSR
jgi:hypothetical protein